MHLTVLSRLAFSGLADDLSACLSFFARPDPHQWPSMFG
jgi:hypothetical protein